MPRKKLSESLTARIFLITAGILLFAGTVTFGLIAWATPSTYTAVVNSDLAAQVDALAGRLADTTPEDCGALLDEFTLSSGASAMLVGPDGELVDTGASLTVQAVYEDERVAVTTAEGDTVVSYGTGTETEETMTITASDGATIATEVTFAGQSKSYTLYVTPRVQVENLAVRALVQMAPWILLVLLAFSMLCAFFYSRYITRPIVRMSGIAGKMAELDFHWECGEKRRDEIGKLGRSLDKLAQRLDAALTDLESANQALRGEVEQERELDRQRMAFFNAASHELKTPLTVILANAGILLAHSGDMADGQRKWVEYIQAEAQRMKSLVEDLLFLARSDDRRSPLRLQTVSFSDLAWEALLPFESVAFEAGVALDSQITPDLELLGDPEQLRRLVAILVDNAVKYAGPRGSASLILRPQGDEAVLSVHNTGEPIPPEHLPRLFERFYRTDSDRARSQGGYGLGLSIAKSIVDGHRGRISVSSSAISGTLFTVRLPLPGRGLGHLRTRSLG